MSDKTKVSVHLGFTANLGNFQALKVDLGVEDWTHDGENVDQAMDRVYHYVEKKLIKKLQDTQKEINAHGL